MRIIDLYEYVDMKNQVRIFFVMDDNGKVIFKEKRKIKKARKK